MDDEHSEIKIVASDEEHKQITTRPDEILEQNGNSENKKEQLKSKSVAVKALPANCRIVIADTSDSVRTNVAELVGAENINRISFVDEQAVAKAINVSRKTVVVSNQDEQPGFAQSIKTANTNFVVYEEPTREDQIFSLRTLFENMLPRLEVASARVIQVSALLEGVGVAAVTSFNEFRSRYIAAMTVGASV